MSTALTRTQPPRFTIQNHSVTLGQALPSHSNINLRTTRTMPPPSSAPVTPMRPVKAILIDCSPAAVNKGTTSIDDVVRAWRALPANTKTAQFVVRTDEFELRRKNTQLVRDKAESHDRDFLCASVCLREVAVAVFKALGLQSQVASLTASVNRDSRLFYLKWANQQTAMLTSHFATLNAEFPAVKSLSAAEALGLFSALTQEANNANKAAHYPSLKQVAWTISFLTTHPHTFPKVNPQHLTQLIQYLLGGIDITAAGADGRFPEWCATGSFATTIETTLRTSTTWKQTTLVGNCDAEVNTAWQVKEFKRYIAHLRKEGKAVDYEEFCKVSTEKAITESARDKLQNEFEILKDRMGQMVDDHEKQNATIVQQDATITTLQGQVAQQEATITTLQDQVAQQNATIVQQNITIVQQDATIATLRGRIAHQDATIAQQDFIIGQQSASIATLQREVDRLNQTVNSLDQFIRAHLAQCRNYGGFP
ncbi:hypothetical protein DFH27DRAFT_639574 [Peziza echinospora]|nr:hypothetical protein DFH27DRAFT_639574 [Peziza echinospora]